MLRFGVTAVMRALRTSPRSLPGYQAANPLLTNTKMLPTFINNASFHSILSNHQLKPQTVSAPLVLQNSLRLMDAITQVPSRSLTKFSLNKGKRKSVKAVVKRFKRLHWGGWIRTRCGRHKKMWKKSVALQKRLRQHVFVNATQAWLLDKMVTKFWRRPKYYIDDPYTPYHTRNEFKITKKRMW